MSLNQKQLRKLKHRIDEIPEVKLYLDGFLDPGKAKESNSSLLELIQMKKVKENQHLSDMLKEIQTIITTSDVIVGDKPAISGAQIDKNIAAAKAVYQRIIDASEVTPAPRPKPSFETAVKESVEQNKEAIEVLSHE